MNLYLYFILTLAIVVAVIYFFIKILGIKEFRLSFKDGFAFIREDIPNLNFSLGNYIGIVVSQDGQVRKIHISIVISSNRIQVIDNFNLVLNKQIKFRLKQFYFEDKNLGIRYPSRTTELPLTIKKDKPLNLRAEFETYEYSSLEFSKGLQNLKLYFKTHHQKAVRKFKINLSESNMKALEIAKDDAIKNHQTQVVNLPIIFV